MKTNQTLRRREFLQLSALGLTGAALGLSGCATHCPFAKQKIPVGVQLYSVREDCKKDFPGTLAALAQMGYPAVEFAGYWNRSAPEIRKMLDDNDLVACGSHTPSEMVQPDKLQATIEFNQTLGNKFIIVPDMTGATKAVWLDKAKQFNDLAAQLAPLGLSIGYHSHFHDFHPVDGAWPWEIFGANTEPRCHLTARHQQLLRWRRGPVDRAEEISRPHAQHSHQTQWRRSGSGHRRGQNQLAGDF